MSDGGQLDGGCLVKTSIRDDGDEPGAQDSEVYVTFRESVQSVTLSDGDERLAGLLD
jgi:hypothetical protein